MERRTISTDLNVCEECLFAISSVLNLTSIVPYISPLVRLVIWDHCGLRHFFNVLSLYGLVIFFPFGIVCLINYYYFSCTSSIVSVGRATDISIPSFLHILINFFTLMSTSIFLSFISTAFTKFNFSRVTSSMSGSFESIVTSSLFQLFFFLSSATIFLRRSHRRLLSCLKYNHIHTGQ